MSNLKMLSLRCCHSERSEESASGGELQIPRFARDDNEFEVEMKTNITIGR
jgi:hypothetical protein